MNPLRYLVQRFLELRARNELAEAHMLAQTERNVAYVGIDGPLRIKRLGIRKALGIAARDAKREPEHCVPGDYDDAELQVLIREARYLARIIVAEALIEHQAAVVGIPPAPLVNVGMLQQQIHGVGQHVLRRVVTGNEEEDQQVGK